MNASMKGDLTLRYFINMKREFKDEFSKVYTFDPGQCRENEDEIELTWYCRLG
ncbi:hypothetical protein [Fictibacillus sp. NRS-1165]|uniref:hypothetical protein n=1 Tax=Fictibacillus sp. NRS-1165 TaxID=3144463 RepID=UPI003D1CBCA6